MRSVAPVRHSGEALRGRRLLAEQARRQAEEQRVGLLERQVRLEARIAELRSLNDDLETRRDALSASAKQTLQENQQILAVLVALGFVHPNSAT